MAARRYLHFNVLLDNKPRQVLTVAEDAKGHLRVLPQVVPLLRVNQFRKTLPDHYFSVHPLEKSESDGIYVTERRQGGDGRSIKCGSMIISQPEKIFYPVFNRLYPSLSASYFNPRANGERHDLGKISADTTLIMMLAVIGRNLDFRSYWTPNVEPTIIPFRLFNLSITMLALAAPPCARGEFVNISTSAPKIDNLPFLNLGNSPTQFFSTDTLSSEKWDGGLRVLKVLSNAHYHNLMGNAVDSLKPENSALRHLTQLYAPIAKP